ncbi:MAG: hypothetical protein KDJ31_17520, partial [Candidatus Competibacteraceae bacterium]|nr:hypothetical protein [Candidatus Competibacteraceae bacterium]
MHKKFPGSLWIATNSATFKRPPMPSSNIALFNLGFRPFFLGAGAFSVIAMALWMAVYLFH